MSMIYANKPNQPRAKLSANKLSLLAVIISVLLTAGYLIYSSYSDARRVHSTTTEVIRDQQLRRMLLASMLKAARQRSLILQKMAAEEDVFALDELNQRFAEQARSFMVAREKLFSLPLTEKELSLLDLHTRQIRINEPIQNKVAELFLEEKHDEAIELLFGLAIPGQIKVFEQISLIIDEYNKDSIDFIENMDREFEDNTYVYILLGGLLLVIGSMAIVIMLTRVSRKEEQQLSQVLDELAEQKFALDQHAIVAITDGDGIITYVNDRLCKISGYSEDEIIGQHHRLLHSAETDKTKWKQMYQTITSGRVWCDVVQDVSKDGRSYWVDATIVPLMGADNKPRSYISIRTDITERKEAELALRRSQKMDALGQLTGGIAHDFNNILNIILGNVEMLKKQGLDNDKSRQRIHNIHKSTIRAAELTRQLLSFSAHQVENETIININQLIKEMKSMIAHSITPQVEIEWLLAKDLWLTEITPGDFDDTLLNLVINARDAMSGSGRITIKTVNTSLDDNDCESSLGIKPGDYVELIISDRGEGMTSEQLEHIYEPFYTTKEQGKGIGLGLAMVFGFIQRAKGFIKVDSEKGEGTTFRLYLPRANATAPVENTASEQVEVTLFGGNETILVVDDEMALAELSEELLSGLGYHVLTAGSAQQALDLLDNEPAIDMLISDVIMPGGINGFELAERATGDYPGLKIIIASGYTENIQAGEKYEKFSNCLLEKPYSHVELAQKVRKIFDRNIVCCEAASGSIS